MRLLTGDYLGVTEPRALRFLLDLKPREGSTFEARVFEYSDEIGFHPKAYPVHGEGRDGSAYVGSSNLTTHGLDRGIELNYRVEPAQDGPGFRAIAAEFERLYSHSRTQALTDDWIGAYEHRRPATAPHVPVEVVSEGMEAPEPHAIQREALEALRATREAGSRAGLVVLATGLGRSRLSWKRSRS